MQTAPCKPLRAAHVRCTNLQTLVGTQLNRCLTARDAAGSVREDPNLTAELAAFDQKEVPPSGAGLQGDFREARDRLMRVRLGLKQRQAFSADVVRLQQMLQTLDAMMAKAERLGVLAR